MVASASTLCSVLILALLLASTLRIQERELFISNSAQYQYEPYPTLRRRLSLSDLQCPTELNRPKPGLPSIPNLLETSTYAASFPGSGYKLITKNLVENITGLLTGEASTSPSSERMKVQKMDRTGFARGQGEVVVVRTHFPHTSGKLAAYDDYLPRAFVVLRNPLHAIPCYFDQLLNGHRLPAATAGSPPENPEEARRAAWIRWRDGEFHSQLLLYRDFVSLWMEKYAGRDERRIFVSYEGLLDDEEGAREALRLAAFLEAGVRENAAAMAPGATVAEAVGTFAGIDEVPCLWKGMVRTTASGGRTATRDEANGFSPRGGDRSSRPFTPENLAATSDVLLELMYTWSHHQRLLNILSGYHREINLERIQRPPDN